MIKQFAGTIAAGAMLLSLGACSSESNDYDAVCVDQVTGQRVDDSRCGGFNGGSYPGFYPYYYPVWVTAPAIGYPMTPGGYQTLPPRAHMTKTRVPTTGGAPKPAASPKPKATKAPKPASTKKPFWKSDPNKPKTTTPPKSGNTYNQPPKGNGGAYKPPASAPKPAAPRPASPPKYK